MGIIEQSLRQFFSQQPVHNITIAYSGGVDSQVLLHALVALKKCGEITQNIDVVHVNHGLSEHADRWQAFAQVQCDKLSVALTCERVVIARKSQQSLEALARNARYQVLTSLPTPMRYIVTGHHGDDQSETFLLALKRGAGVKGLSAMSLKTPLGNHFLVRPLLEVSRECIKAYAKTHKLEWVEDESNADIQFDRNFLRHEVMPVLKSRWPSIDKTILRSSRHCQETQQLLNELAEQDLANCATNAESIGLPELLALSQQRFNNAIRYFLATQNCLMPSTEQLLQLYTQLGVSGDKQPAIKVGEHWLRRFQQRIYLTTEMADVSKWQHTIALEKLETANLDVELPDNLGLISFLSGTASQAMAIVAPQPGQTVSLRFCHNNPSCLPDYRQHSRPLKKVLQELKIPTWQRQRTPFLFYDNELVAVLGYFVCKEYIAKDNKKQLFVRWYRDNN